MLGPRYLGQVNMVGSGGGHRMFLTTIGVNRALNENHIKPNNYIATSMSAPAFAMMATDYYDSKQMKEIEREFMVPENLFCEEVAKNWHNNSELKQITSIVMNRDKNNTDKIREKLLDKQNGIDMEKTMDSRYGFAVATTELPHGLMRGLLFKDKIGHSACKEIVKSVDELTDWTIATNINPAAYKKGITINGVEQWDGCITSQTPIIESTKHYPYADYTFVVQNNTKDFMTYERPITEDIVLRLGELVVFDIAKFAVETGKLPPVSTFDFGKKVDETEQYGYELGQYFIEKARDEGVL